MIALINIYFFCTKYIAAITPGIHPNIVKNSTNKTVPSPLSITATGGRIIQNNTLKNPML